MPKRDRLAAIAFGLKLAITLGLFAYLLRKVDLAPVLGQLRAMSPAAVAGAELLLVLQLGLLALRWHIVSGIVQAPMPLRQVLRLTAIGHFFNQVLPSGFAGDAARAWLAAREGVRLGPAVRAIVCDRVIGLLVLVLMVSVTLFAVPDVAADKVPGKSTFRLIALLAGGMLVALLLLGAPVARLLMRHPLTESPGRLTHDLHSVLFDRADEARWWPCSRWRSSFSTWRRCTGARRACASIWTSVHRWSSSRLSCWWRWLRSRSPAGACGKAP